MNLESYTRFTREALKIKSEQSEKQFSAIKRARETKSVSKVTAELRCMLEQLRAIGILNLGPDKVRRKSYPNRVRNEEDSNTEEKYIQTTVQEFFERVSKRGSGKEISERRTIKVAQVTVIKEIGENSGKNRKENMVSADMKHRNRA